MRTVIGAILALVVLVPSPRGQTPAGGNPITRVPLIETRTMHVDRVTYAPGAVEPAGNHGFDVVLVPDDHDEMNLHLEGAPVNWTHGRPILISRGAPHQLTNSTGNAISFIEVRTTDDSPAGTDEAISSERATIVRSVFGKYLRATVLRIDQNGSVEWPIDRVDAVEIIMGPWPPVVTGASPQITMRRVPANRVTAFDESGRNMALRSITNHSIPYLEVVRVSRMVSR